MSFRQRRLKTQKNKINFAAKTSTCIGAPAASIVRFAILPLWLEQLLVNACSKLPAYFFTPLGVMAPGL
jgi:hypothetical protein